MRYVIAEDYAAPGRPGYAILTRHVPLGQCGVYEYQIMTYDRLIQVERYFIIFE